jgi:hypothetical protein
MALRRARKPDPLGPTPIPHTYTAIRCVKPFTVNGTYIPEGKLLSLNDDVLQLARDYPDHLAVVTLGR